MAWKYMLISIVAIHHLHAFSFSAIILSEMELRFWNALRNPYKSAGYKCNMSYLLQLEKKDEKMFRLLMMKVWRIFLYITQANSLFRHWKRSMARYPEAVC